MTMTVPVSVHRSRNGQLVSPSSAPQMHPRVILEADLAGHLMGVKEAAQFGDHFDMAWLACSGGVGAGEQATFEPVEIKALPIGKGVRGMGAAEELTERCGVDVFMAEMPVPEPTSAMTDCGVSAASSCSSVMISCG